MLSSISVNNSEKTTCYYQIVINYKGVPSYEKWTNVEYSHNVLLPAFCLAFFQLIKLISWIEKVAGCRKRAQTKPCRTLSNEPTILTSLEAHYFLCDEVQNYVLCPHICGLFEMGPYIQGNSILRIASLLYLNSASDEKKLQMPDLMNEF